jgi:hypothetical protein
MSSGIGFYYGHTGSDRSVLEDLLKVADYDFEGYDQYDIDGVRSIVDSLPVTLRDSRPYAVWMGTVGKEVCPEDIY